jgi:membrane protein implicated in regulation of membrane protease activity
MSRAFFLHRAVISLAMGVILLPVAFVKLTFCAGAFIVGAALLIVFLLPTLIRVVSKRRKNRKRRNKRKPKNEQATTP